MTLGAEDARGNTHRDYISESCELVVARASSSHRTSLASWDHRGGIKKEEDRETWGAGARRDGRIAGTSLHAWDKPGKQRFCSSGHVESVPIVSVDTNSGVLATPRYPI